MLQGDFGTNFRRTAQICESRLELDGGSIKDVLVLGKMGMATRFDIVNLRLYVT